MTLHSDTAVVEPPKARPSAQRIVELSWGLQRTNALVSALDLDVFSLIAEGCRTPHAVADAAGLDERATASLLLALAGLGLLEPDELGGYTLAPDADTYLVRGRKAYLGDLRHVHRRLNFAVWPQLTDAVRTGEPPQEAFAATDHDVWESVLPYLDAIGAPAARWVAELVDEHALPAPRVLDAGCGSGLFGQTIARLDPAAKVCGIDRPAIVAVATERARERGVDVSYSEGDLRTSDWGSDFDAVILSNVLHGYAAGDCAALLKRAAAGLAPGGLLVIHEFIPDPAAPAQTPMAALFGLELLLTSAGAAHTEARYREWIEAAGLIGIHHEQAPAGPTSVMLARAPAQ